MKPKYWRRYAVAAVACFAILGAASPALAWSSNTTGAEAWGGRYSGDWKVWDTMCDAHSVYGLYIENNSSDTQRKDNSAGCGSMASRSFSNGVGSVKACRNVQLQPDNCGGWNEW